MEVLPTESYGIIVLEAVVRIHLIGICSLMLIQGLSISEVQEDEYIQIIMI